MRGEYKADGLICYERERADLLREAMEAMARLDAQRLEDTEAAQVWVLFDPWTPGVAYEVGQRICDGEGNLYRVVQRHVAQSDWPVGETPALYTKLGLTAETPDAIPDWVQPLGGHDAYHKGDRVRYEGKIYESVLDANVWAPDTIGWVEVAE